MLALLRTCQSFSQNSTSSFASLIRGFRLKWVGKRDYCIGYKPKERTKHAQDLEVLTHRNLLLFRHDNNANIFRKTFLAISLFPVWGYLGYFAFYLRNIFEPIREENSHWAVNNVYMLSRGVGMAFWLFGAGVTGYWLLRTWFTVHKVILKKGGKYMTLITYNLIGSPSKYRTIAVQHLDAAHSHNFKGQERFFLKVRDEHFKYQLNLSEGVFLNKPLFMKTVGYSRGF